MMTNVWMWVLIGIPIGTALLAFICLALENKP